MNVKMMESYLDNIAEQVVDEDKIVTYKSLSRSLGLHVNTAKQLLYTYLNNEKSKNAFPISATYLVAGKVVDGSFKVIIVNEADLKDAQATFIEITSEHVYSVQKGKSLKDMSVLCGINKESSSSESSKSVISCSKAALKSTEVKKKPESYKESNKKAIKAAFFPEKPLGAAGSVETKQKSETNPSKETSTKSPKKPSPKGNQQKPQETIKKPSGNIANLFAKAAQKKTTKSDSTTKPAPKEQSKTNEPEVANVDITKEPESEKTAREDSGGRSNSRESLKRKKKGNKRKRIQMLSDSEDDSDEEEEEEEEEKIDKEEDEDNLPNTIDLEEEKEEDKEFVPKNKRKKRKVIDRTVMNEDGYLETKKEVVFETDSENEPEGSSKTVANETQKNAEPVGKGKGAQISGMAKKQSSLLTFFKKS